MLSGNQVKSLPPIEPDLYCQRLKGMYTLPVIILTAELFIHLHLTIAINLEY